MSTNNIGNRSPGFGIGVDVAQRFSVREAIGTCGNIGKLNSYETPDAVLAPLGETSSRVQSYKSAIIPTLLIDESSTYFCCQLDVFAVALVLRVTPDCSADDAQTNGR